MPHFWIPMCARLGIAPRDAKTCWRALRASRNPALQALVFNLTTAARQLGPLTPIQMRQYCDLLMAPMQDNPNLRAVWLTMPAVLQHDGTLAPTVAARVEAAMRARLAGLAPVQPS